MTLVINLYASNHILFKDNILNLLIKLTYNIIFNNKYIYFIIFTRLHKEFTNPFHTITYKLIV